MARKIQPKRIDRAEELDASSLTDREIRKKLSAEFSCSQRQATRYLAIARERIHARTPPPEHRREKIIALLLHAYDVAEIGHPERGPNASAMVAAAAKLADVTGATAPTKIEHSGSIGAKPESTLDDFMALRARVATNGHSRGSGANGANGSGGVPPAGSDGSGAN